MEALDRTEQRIVGVLIEKQLAVPDSYPLTENALLAGCNQSSNRDPQMALERFQVAGALMALHEKEVVARVEGSGRVPKYRHKLDERLALGDRDLPVLAELLLRGPQAPGALKPRVARMGLHATPEQILEVLQNLAAQKPPLVTQLAQRPRERDRRWQHLLGDASQAVDDGAGGDAGPTVAGGAAPSPLRPSAPISVAGTSITSERAAGSLDDVLPRLEALERRVRDLEQALGHGGPDDAAASDPPS